jgi:hypothetical protein
MMSMILLILVTHGLPIAQRDTALLEHGYIALARDLKSPVPCERIRARAGGVAAFNHNDTETSYTRSECYDALAAATNNPAWCEKVVQRRSLVYRGSYYSPARCRDRVRTGDAFALSVAYGATDEVLQAFGCTEEDVIAAVPRGAEFRRMAGNSYGLWLQVYERLLSDGSLARHLADLPGLAHGEKTRAVIPDPSWPCHHAP